MSFAIPSQPPTRQPSELFAESASALFAQHRSFASVVRQEYLSIEDLIQHGVSLDVIAQELSKCYGVQGSLSAFKSALSRIRRAYDGRACQDWLDQLPPPHVGAYGMPPKASSMGNSYSGINTVPSRIPFWPQMPFPPVMQSLAPYGHVQQSGPMPIGTPSNSVAGHEPYLQEGIQFRRGL